MKKFISLALALTLSLSTVSLADNEKAVKPSAKAESVTSVDKNSDKKVQTDNHNKNDKNGKKDNSKSSDKNDKKDKNPNIATNEDGIFKNVIHQRFQGDNRAKTAVNVQRHYFANTDKVVLVNDNAYPDAISATNMSMGKYPLLYTGKGKLPIETKSALDKMFLDEIYLLGGVNSISKKVENYLKKEFPTAKITRIQGKNRYETSSASAKYRAQAKNLIFAAGTNYADALYATSLAAYQKAPILLASNDGVDNSTLNYIKSIKNIENVTIVGGNISVNEKIKSTIESATRRQAVRLSGVDRYESSVEVAKRVNANPAEVITTSGEVFADALVSSTVAQKIQAPILLVKKDVIPEKVKLYLKHTNSIYKLTTIGGFNTVTKNNYSTQVILISGLDIDKPLVDRNGKGIIKAFTKDYKKYYILPNNKYYNSIKQYDKLFVYLRDALAEDYRPVE